MSLIEPKIDELLERADNDRFLLCTVAAKRARDINDMLRGQRDRAAAQSLSVQVARATDKKPLSFISEILLRILIQKSFNNS